MNIGVDTSVHGPGERGEIATLLARHDRPGPRYTSYPTAVEFHEELDPGMYERHLAAANAKSDEPLSLYVHLPFCEHRCLFCGCHVFVTQKHELASPYIDTVLQEAALLADRLPDRRALGQVHLGGGTPTYSSPAELDRLLTGLFQHFTRRDDAELAVEVDPRVTTRQHMEVLAEHGFNRISLGVQDFTPKVQEAIERIQSVEQTRAIVEAARELGFGGVNVDLIYGLPYQQSETFEQTVEEVLALGVDRSAVYSFAFVPWIRGHQKTLDPEDLPDAATKLDLFALARERFLGAGYEPIGMDHFARPDDELARAKREGRLRRNFQGYTVVAGDTVVGLGVSSIGDVEGGYFQNEKKLPAWRTAVESGQLPVYRGVIASPDDLLRRHVIQELMCNTRVDVRDVEKRFDIDFRTTFAEDLARLEPLVEEGLAHVDATEVRATPLGTMFLRNLAMCFDRYWRERHEGGDKPVFSRTV